MSDSIEEHRRINELMIKYHNNKIALTINQYDEMWKIWHKIRAKCTHPSVIERHFSFDYTDEYGSWHSQSECHLICCYCDIPIQKGKHWQHGADCCIEKTYVSKNYYKDVAILLEKLNSSSYKRTEQLMERKLIFKNTYMWVPKGPELPKAPPLPPEKPDYIKSLESLESLLK